MAKFSLPHAPAPRAYGILAPPIPRPLDLVADDVVDPIGGDEEDPVCVLCSRGYLKGLVLCQPLRDLRESILGFVQAFVDSIQHSSGGGGLINARSSTGSLGAASGAALHRFSLVGLFAGINQPNHHTIGHALILLCWAFVVWDSNHSKNSTSAADEKFSTKFSVASRNTLLRFLALFVARFGGVRPLVDILGDVWPLRRGGARIYIPLSPRTHDQVPRCRLQPDQPAPRTPRTSSRSVYTSGRLKAYQLGDQRGT